ncbi:MAG: hypothetical protein ACXW3K_06530 [Brevundimonas sp.]
MVRRLGLIAALYLIGAGPAWPQTAPTAGRQEPPATTLEDVIVSGQTVKERAERFVDEVAQPVQRRGLARWDRPACFGVVNFNGDAARSIADQLVARADELGLPVGDIDCEPNVFVIGAVDAPDVARAWVARSPGAFQPGVSGTVGRPSALRYFVSSEDAVRWWHVSIPMHFDIFTQMTQPAVRLPGRPAPHLRVYARSQHASRIRDDLQKVLVLVDVGRLGPVTLDQLCDYLLMIAYAQIDPEGDTTGYETVLNLFDDPSVPGLTDWDKSYLTALYEADPDRRVSASAAAERLAGVVVRADTALGE